jgi:hypothetical protein
MDIVKMWMDIVKNVDGYCLKMWMYIVLKCGWILF